VDNSDAIWLALAFVLVIEGLFPFISPSAWRRTFSQLLKLTDGQLRFFAMFSILAGLLLMGLLL
jgi:uncharacterized protein YjeT (DUF2065 family)